MVADAHRLSLPQADAAVESLVRLVNRPAAEVIHQLQRVVPQYRPYVDRARDTMRRAAA
jgi:hypothetical protein